MTRLSRCFIVAAAIAVAVGGGLTAGCRPSATPPLQSAAKLSEQPEFFGVGSQGHKIAYAIDRSGSMTDSMMYVKCELRRSIASLRSQDQFYTAFFSSGPALEMPARKLVPATEANKMAAYEFIDSIVPTGQTDPFSSVKRCFEVRPDAIYILSDGEFERKLIDFIDKLNPQRRVVVNTICFIYKAGEPLLKEIAERNGGTYKYVGENDLEAIGRPERGASQAMP